MEALSLIDQIQALIPSREIVVGQPQGPFKHCFVENVKGISEVQAVIVAFLEDGGRGALHTWMIGDSASDATLKVLDAEAFAINKFIDDEPATYDPDGAFRLIPLGEWPIGSLSEYMGEEMRYGGELIYLRAVASKIDTTS